MGGQNEKIVTPPSTGRVISLINGSVRIHENQGEVHLHDDLEKLKVAIPVGDFWNAWERCRTSMSTNNAPFATSRLVDTKNSTCAIIETQLHEVGTECRLQSTVKIIKIVIDPSYQQINDFAAGR